MLSLQKDALKSRNRELGELFESGFGIHHAGMLRSDRSLTEKMFSEGVIKVRDTEAGTSKRRCKGNQRKERPGSPS